MKRLISLLITAVTLIVIAATALLLLSARPTRPVSTTVSVTEGSVEIREILDHGLKSEPIIARAGDSVEITSKVPSHRTSILFKLTEQMAPQIVERLINRLTHDVSGLVRPGTVQEISEQQLRDSLTRSLRGKFDLVDIVLTEDGFEFSALYLGPPIRAEISGYGQLYLEKLKAGKAFRLYVETFKIRNISMPAPAIRIIEAIFNETADRKLNSRLHPVSLDHKDRFIELKTADI